MLARGRLQSKTTDSLTSKVNVDARILRADARYYFRVDQKLPAAITFARAAMQDNQPDRSVESAIRSAAILRDLGKQAAAAELLLQIADRNADGDTIASLRLQAAVLLSETDDAPLDQIVEILERCSEGNSASRASATARNWLIEIRVSQNNLIDAARLATQLPKEGWTPISARRCRSLWLDSIVEREDYADRLKIMHSIFETTIKICENENLRQTYFELTALLDPHDSTQLSIAANELDNMFLMSLAAFRIDPSIEKMPGKEIFFEEDSKEAAAVRWRLDLDLKENPKSSQSLSTFLLKHFASDDLKTLRWLCLSGHAGKAIALMRSQMANSSEPSVWIRQAAISLSRSQSNRQTNLRIASDLWGELASGLPENSSEETNAEIESVRSLFQSGDRDSAAARAKFLLLTRPIKDESSMTFLESILTFER